MTQARVGADVPSAREILSLLAARRPELVARGVRTLGLFGSFARGNPREDSDVDLLVTLGRPSFSDYMDIKFFLEDLLQRPVDLVLEGALKPRVRAQVLAEVIYATGLSPLSR